MRDSQSLLSKEKVRHDQHTLIDLLELNARFVPDKVAFTFLHFNRRPKQVITYYELSERAKRIATFLKQSKIDRKNIFLIYPPGIEFIAAFFGCVYASNIPVPVYPPFGGNWESAIARLNRLAAVVEPSIVLTNSDLMRYIKMKQLASKAKSFFRRKVSLPDTEEGIIHLMDLNWVATDQLIKKTSAQDWQKPGIPKGFPALIQFTSGSTSKPKGVVLTHDNLLHNLKTIHAAFEVSESTVAVGWLPLYHDMGLIGNILGTVYSSCEYNFMSPVDFIQKPLRWLETISTYKANCCGGPNFAYELCTKKVKEESLATLDLSSWELAYNGAERVLDSTMKSFYQKFQPCGFRLESFYPCYGMAEASLFVSGGKKGKPYKSICVDKEALKDNRVEIVAPEHENAQSLVSCGFLRHTQKAVIIERGGNQECPANGVGEIWIAGGNVSNAYWKQDLQELSETFAYLGEDDTLQYFKTGDMGFFYDGELIVVGRTKELIIIRGKNYYPQDIAKSVAQAHEWIRKGSVAAFSVDGELGEELVVVVELKRDALKMKSAEALEIIRKEVVRLVVVNHELSIRELVFVHPYSIPKTSSGKVKILACKEQYLTNELRRVALD